jgi:hypothetical protein
MSESVGCTPLHGELGLKYRICLLYNRKLEDQQKWAPGGVEGVQNVPHSTWIKTDAAADVSQQTSRLPFYWQRRFLPTRCEVHSVPPVPTSGDQTGQTKLRYRTQNIIYMRA